MPKKVWINNGCKHRRIENLQPLEEGWVLGKLPHSSETKLKMSETRKGRPRKPHTEETKQKMRKPKIDKTNYSNRQKGMTYVNNGVKRKTIKPEELEAYLTQGWKLGGFSHSEECKKKMSDNQKGMFYINNGVERKRIHREELEGYLAQGWVKGNIAGRIKINNGTQEKTIPRKELQPYLAQGWSKGKIDKRIYVNNGIETKLIMPELLQSLGDGWLKGRIHIPKTWVNNGIECRCISKDLLQEFLEQGWILGGLKRAKIITDQDKKAKRLAALEERKKLRPPKPITFQEKVFSEGPFTKCLLSDIAEIFQITLDETLLFLKLPRSEKENLLIKIRDLLENGMSLDIDKSINNLILECL